MTQTPDTPSRRQLMVEWQDPEPIAKAAGNMSGLAYMRAFLTGELPNAPMSALMDFSGVEVEDGRVLFRGEPGEQHLNPIGSVHGGYAATLLDSALGCSIHTTLPAGVAYTTVDLAVTFVGAISPATGPLLCEANVVHRGRTVRTATAELRSERDGRLLAHGSTTCLILGATFTS